MRWIVLAAVALLGCASPQGSPMDGGGPDMSVSHCDPRALYDACSAQCHLTVCIVGKADCVSGQWLCDCSLVGPCPNRD